MNRAIHLDTVSIGGDEPLRLNLFAGRHLGEREFDLLQAYANDRLDAYLATQWPGIVSGLEASLEHTTNGQHRLQVRPGQALGGDGLPIRLHYPLSQSWPQLLSYARRQLAGRPLSKTDEQAWALPDGLYFLQLQQLVEVADAASGQLPCLRTEADPLRDQRLETVALLGLRLITTSPSLLALPQSRAANRLCARFLDQSPFDAINGGVPLALVKIIKEQPEWFDLLAGRYLAQPDAPYRTLLAHAQAVMSEYSRALAAAGKSPDPKLTLAEQLGLDYLPAAGPLPAELLIDVAGEKPGIAPGLGFAARDLQVELLPIPAATVPAMVERELPRGLVDLVGGRGDRIRLLLAVDDPDYRPNLLDLPQPDAELEKDLDERGKAAIKAWQAWRKQWLVLFHKVGGFTEPQLKDLQAPPLPKTAAEEQQLLKNLTAPACINKLVELREKQLKNNEPLPHPYSDWKKVQVGEIPLENATVDGLHAQRLTLETSIDHLEAELEENFQLLNELSDFLGLQRQHLDAITVSFSGLAGGVPGDGSGMNLMRWSKYADFEPKLTASQSAA